MAQLQAGSTVDGSAILTVADIPTIILSALLPAGLGPLPWCTDTPPTGWLLCYGQAVSRTTYSALFAVIGTTFGNGDGSTTFNMPDFRGRLPLGKDNMGGSSANRVTDSDADIIGGADGDETKNLQHVHVGATHYHTVGLSGIGVSGPDTTNGDVRISGGGESHYYATDPRNTSNNTAGDTGKGGSTTQDIMPPFLTVNYIMKY